MHTHRHLHRSNFKKPGVHWPHTPGLKSDIDNYLPVKPYIKGIKCTV